MALRTSEMQELFEPGQKAIYSGEYTIVDEKGNPQGNDIITLDEGDTFPVVDGINAYYQLNSTCLEEE